MLQKTFLSVFGVHCCSGSVCGKCSLHRKKCNAIFLCFWRQTLPWRRRHTDETVGYIGINSSILLVTAMSVDRFICVVCPHFYLRKIKPKQIVVWNAIIVGFSAIFASLQLSGIPMDVYISVTIHLHTTFPLVTTTLAYLGMFFVLRKRFRVDFQRQTSMPSNPTLHDMRQLRRSQTERKFAGTSFFILLSGSILCVKYS